MAETVTLADLANLSNDGTAIAAINANNTIIEETFLDCLSLEGRQPNAMQSNLDMNNNQILNLPSPATINSPVRLRDVSASTGVPITSVPPVGTSGAVVGFLNGNNIYSGTSTFTGPVVLPNGSTLTSTLPAVADKIIYVSTVGNDSNNGLSQFYSKLTLQSAVDAAAGGGIVYVGSGTYTLSVSLKMQPGVRLIGSPGVIITQGNGTNLINLINFSTNSANNASLENLTVDGNRANNTDNINVIMVAVGTANDVTIRDCILRNSNGILASTFTGLKTRYLYNNCTNCFGHALAHITGTPFTSAHTLFQGNRVISNIGWHAITVANADYCTIIDNEVIGDMIGNPTSPLHVSTSGTTCTWVSGPTFNNITAGNYLVINGGQEYLVATVNSNTSITLGSSAPVLTNVLAAIGTGDLIYIDSSSYCICSNNHVSTNISQGISVNTGTGGEVTQKCLIQGNHVQYAGEMGICLQQTGAVGLQDNSIVDNIIQNAGQSGSVATGGGAAQAAILISGNTIFNTWISGNYIRDDQITPTTTYWLGLTNSVPAGNVILGRNGYIGTANNNVLNDITSITLSSGWGSTASTSAVISQGSSVILTVNSSGTGQGLQPTVTIAKICDTSSSLPLISCQEVNSNASPFQFVVGEQNSTSGSWTFTFNGTPVAGSFYTFIAKG